MKNKIQFKSFIILVLVLILFSGCQAKENSEVNVNEVINLINELNDNSNKSEVEDARNAYDNLSNKDKKAFSHELVIKLQDQENRIYYLNDTKLIQDKIDSLNNDSSKEDIIATKEAYEALNENAKRYIAKSYLDKLQEQEARIINQINAKDVEDKINALTNNSSTNEINMVKDAYELLSKEAQSYVSSDALNKLLNKLDNIDYQKEARAVSNEIKALSNLSSESQVYFARQAYESLSVGGKSYISKTTLAILEEQEKRISDQKEAIRIEDIIFVLNNQSSVDDIKEARRLYNDASDEAQNYISDSALENLKKQEKRIKNQGKGELINAYFAAYARQPEAAKELNEAKDNLLSAFNQTNSVGRCTGLASLKEVFDAIARQSDYSDTLISTEKDLINRILNANNSDVAEAIGMASPSLFDAIARQPEIKDRLIKCSNVINNAINNTEGELRAKAIALLALDFYDACAREPLMTENLFSYLKEIINDINNISETKALSLNYSDQSGSGFFAACARQPEATNNMWEEYKNYIRTLY